jgi:hypothetical protein
LLQRLGASFEEEGFALAGGLMFITVLGWDKINPRKDVDNPSWFKFKHKFFDDCDFYDFSALEKVCWIYFLCEASKKNDHGKFRLSLPHAQNIGGIEREIVHQTIKKLKKLRLVETRTLRGRYADVTDAGAREEKIREEKIREEEIRVDKREIEKAFADIGMEETDVYYDSLVVDAYEKEGLTLVEDA